MCFLEEQDGMAEGFASCSVYEYAKSQAIDDQVYLCFSLYLYPADLCHFNQIYVIYRTNDEGVFSLV